MTNPTDQLAEALKLAQHCVDDQEYLGTVRLESVVALKKALAAYEAQKSEPNIDKCPTCDGEADNGFDRCLPPSPYQCTKCEAQNAAPDEVRECHRSACKKKDTPNWWWNPSTRNWYCQKCAEKINETNVIDLCIQEINLPALRASTPDPRIVEFFASTGIGYGDDPIGFLLASHAELARQRNELRASTDGVVVPSWKTIDSAPRDGKEILVAYGHQGFVKKLVNYNTLYGYWQSKGVPELGLETNATHWMPLPAPPKDGEK